MTAAAKTTVSAFRLPSPPARHRAGPAILLVVVSCILSLLIGEGLLRWLDIGAPPVFARHQQYGYLMVPNQSVSTRGYRFHINQAGFRGSDFSWAKPPGVYRIAFTGDSITYGGGSIAEEDLFVNRVASTMSSHLGTPVEAVNLCIQNIAGYVATQGLPATDLFIWVIPSADFRRPKTSLEEHGFVEQRPLSRFTFLVSSLGWEVMTRMRRQFGVRHGEVVAGEIVLRQNVRTVQKVLTRIGENGYRAMIAFVPAETESEIDRRDRALFRSSAESIAVPFLDLEAAFDRQSSNGLYLDGVHLSSRGHEVVADGIVEFLTRANWPH
jgi:lysophospholipase L1-like esterase